jgi:hypothetical protein
MHFQARSRQEYQITDDEWQKRSDLITAEHRLPAEEQLEQHWKAWIAQARRTAAARTKAAAAEIPEYGAEQFTTLPPASQHNTLSKRHSSDTPDVLAKRCSSWRQGEKSGPKIRFLTNADKIQKNLDLIKKLQKKFRGNSEEIQKRSF